MSSTSKISNFKVHTGSEDVNMEKIKQLSNISKFVLGQSQCRHFNTGFQMLYVMFHNYTHTQAEIDTHKY